MKSYIPYIQRVSTTINCVIKWLLSHKASSLLFRRVIGIYSCTEPYGLLVRSSVIGLWLLNGNIKLNIVKMFLYKTYGFFFCDLKVFITRSKIYGAFLVRVFISRSLRNSLKKLNEYLVDTNVCL